MVAPGGGWERVGKRCKSLLMKQSITLMLLARGTGTGIGIGIGTAGQGRKLDMELETGERHVAAVVFIAAVVVISISK